MDMVLNLISRQMTAGRQNGRPDRGYIGAAQVAGIGAHAHGKGDAPAPGRDDGRAD